MASGRGRGVSGQRAPFGIVVTGEALPMAEWEEANDATMHSAPLRKAQ